MESNDQSRINSKKTTKRIATKIRELRGLENLSQEEFAERVCLDRRTISRAESGDHRPAPETIEQIALEFKLPVSYFYDYSTIRSKEADVEIINKIMATLRVIPSDNLRKIEKLIDVINE